MALIHAKRTHLPTAGTPPGLPHRRSARTPPPPRALFPLALLVAPAAAACGAAEPPPVAAPPHAVAAPHAAGAPARRAASIVALGPARYVAPPGLGLVERAVIDGRNVDRAVIDGQRAELRGLEELVPVGSASPELAGGAAFPAWTGAGAPAGPRYLFWSGSELLASRTFSGELRALGALPGEVAGVFPWLDGLGLITAAEGFAVHGATGTLRPLDLPSVVAAAAASERRALALTVFGRALLTLDAGASYRDVTAELGGAIALEVRGEEIVVSLDGGTERVLDASGRIGEPRAPRPRPTADGDPRWRHRAPFTQLEDAVLSGLPLPDGGAVVVADGHVGRIDLATGRATSVAALPPGSGACAPFRAADALLAVCAGPDRASVVDLSGGPGAPRIERTFALRPAREPKTDRFVGVDGEALGYVGPCEGAPRPRLDLDAIAHAPVSPGSTQQSAVFCVRRGPGVWVEHHLDPADATDVLAWIPRRGGGAVALIARHGAFLRDNERVEARGALRVVRFARNEPPLVLPRYGDDSPALLSRALAVLADDSIEGWLPTNGGAGVAPIAIDPAGRLRRLPTPAGAVSIAASGPFALAATEDGALFETVDRGRRWVPVAPPPGRGVTHVERCSAVGCRVGAFLRLGWASAAPSGAARAGQPPGAPPPGAQPPGTALPPPSSRHVMRGRGAPWRQVPPPPIVRLACAFTGPPAAARVPGSSGFGAVPAPPVRASPLRLGTVGALTLPPISGAQPALGGDAELAWIATFDVRAEIHRTSVPLARAGLAGLAYRPYEAQLGYVIDRDGRVAPIAVGPKETCLASLLEAARVTRPIGGCAAPSSVGVDLGERVMLLSPRHDTLAVSTVELRGGGRPTASAGTWLGVGARAPVLRELHAQRTARVAGATSQRARFAYGAGVRAGAPVFVAVARSGGAVLSAVDPERGTFSPEEALAPLGELGVGSAPRCAPRRDDVRVVLPFDAEIGLVPGALPGVIEAGTAGVAVIRWSRDRACLDAIELNVRDERFETDFGYYEPPGAVKKLLVRFAGPNPSAPLGAYAAGDLGREAGDRGRPSVAPAWSGPAPGAGGGTLVLIQPGQEVRQPVRCEAIAR